MSENNVKDVVEKVLNSADCLYTREQVEKTIETMASQIESQLSDDNPVVLTIMNGGLVFAGQLLTHLNFPLVVDYCHATRYRGETSGGELHWKALPQVSLTDRNVLVVDDILDEGHTLLAILNAIKAQGAKQVYTAVLVEKVHDRKAEAEFKADFTGMKVEDRYVFGYGMDYKEYLRNAPGIYALKEEK
ncbi:hypoxanthine-guanine phosphoribosyltransferase [Pleionea sediminis]|uniref:hypoxanthine-guanine phosphoribosyltransferase n=1 Tax=Pleionea sediminis TaxID=2569479 RepID=UPI001184B9CC|nr:hypoxanthine-guanine phosphoribosyltransferase [Pleionea sediminis]